MKSRIRLPLLLFSLSPLLLLLAAGKKPAGAAETASISDTTPAKDSIVTFTVSFVGDLMCHSPQFNAAFHKETGTYDFAPQFSEVKQFLAAADYTIGNLETTTAGGNRTYSGYPNFNSPDSYLDALKDAGFDMLITSNNHSMDLGESGLLRTIEQVDARGFDRTGTFSSQRDRDSIRIVSRKGLKMAVLNYTYGTNGAYPSPDHKYMLNVADSTLVGNDIRAARKLGADLVVVTYHWGWEYYPEPVAKQDTMYRYAVAAGADMIIGSHPHVVGPVDYFKTSKAKLDTGFVAWTLGNFISNQSKRYTDAGVIINLEIKKNITKDSCWISSTSYVPTWVYRGTNSANPAYQVLPAQWCERDSLPAWLTPDLKEKMSQAYSDTRAIINKRWKQPQVVPAK